MRAACLVLLLLIAACTGPYPSDMLRRPAVPDYPAADTTYLLFDPAQGFRVEYAGGEGRIFAWAPGAGAVIPGVWRLVEAEPLVNSALLIRAGRQVCLRFGARTAGPLGPGDWDCRPQPRAADAVVAGLTGDVFGLSTAPVPPWPLERCRPPGAFTLPAGVGC